MENMGLVSKAQLTQLDSIIYDPKSAPLVARACSHHTKYQLNQTSIHIEFAIALLKLKNTPIE